MGTNALRLVGLQCAPVRILYDLEFMLLVEIKETVKGRAGEEKRFGDKGSKCSR